MHHPTSRPPTLDVFEGLSKWGECRLRPEHRENLTYVELKKHGRDEEWKPLFAFMVVGGQVVFRLQAATNGRTVVYDPTTNTFSDLSTGIPVRDDSSVRGPEGG